MPAPAASILRGNPSTPILLSRRIKRNPRDLDSGQLRFVSNNRDHFTQGQVLSQLPGFKVDIVESDDVGTGLWEHNLNVYGTTATKYIPGSYKESRPQEGFDTASARWLTTNRHLVRLGQSMADLPGVPAGVNGLFCVDAKPEQHEQSSLHWWINADFAGLFEQKETKVKWSSNGREITKDNLINGMPAGWSDPRRSEVLWGRQSMTLSYVTTSVPVWVRVPEQTGGAPHVHAPNVFTPVLSGPASEFTWHWPSGWTRQGVDCDIIPGTTICHIVEHWIYNPPVTFG